MGIDAEDVELTRAATVFAFVILGGWTFWCGRSNRRAEHYGRPLLARVLLVMKEIDVFDRLMLPMTARPVR